MPDEKKSEKDSKQTWNNRRHYITRNLDAIRWSFAELRLLLVTAMILFLKTKFELINLKVKWK